MKNNLSRLWDLLEKSETGPISKEQDFDLKLFSKSKEIIKSHDIKYDPEYPVPDDNSLADDVFNAGFELYLDLGTFFINTSSVSSTAYSFIIKPVISFIITH